MIAEDVKSIPKGAWDTHHHIFEPDKYPLSADRHFTPSTASLEELVAFEQSLGIDHVCIAHGLSYGADCTSLLEYLKFFGGQARGICVLDLGTVTDETLDRYHAMGVRSVRIDFFKTKAMDDVQKQIELIQATAEVLTQWGRHTWSVQIQQPHLNHWYALRPVIASLSVPVVVDHIGLIQAPSMADCDAKTFTPPTEVDGFQELLGALKDGNTWIKISAPYRCSDIFHTYDDLKEPIRAIIATNPHRMVWGSDWPHTQRHKDRVGKSTSQLEEFLKIDDAAWVRSLSRWLSDEEWQLMWVENPSKLYY